MAAPIKALLQNDLGLCPREPALLIPQRRPSRSTAPPALDLAEALERHPATSIAARPATMQAAYSTSTMPEKFQAPSGYSRWRGEMAVQLHSPAATSLAPNPSSPARSTPSTPPLKPPLVLPPVTAILMVPLLFQRPPIPIQSGTPFSMPLFSSMRLLLCARPGKVLKKPRFEAPYSSNKSF